VSWWGKSKGPVSASEAMIETKASVRSILALISMFLAIVILKTLSARSDNIYHCGKKTGCQELI
jgi:hypothetical protein